MTPKANQLAVALAAGLGLCLMVPEVPAELVGNWRFNGDLTSTITPLQDGAFNGTGSPSYVTNGNQVALSLDGVDQYVTAAGTGGLDMDQSSFTLAVWLRVLSVPTARREAVVAGKADASNLANYALTVDYNNQVGTVSSLLTYGYTRRAAGNNASLASVLYFEDVVTDLNLVLTYDQPTQALTLYRNSAIRDDITGVDYGPIATGGTFYIGRNPFGTFLHGEIDEVQVYNHAMNQAEVTDLYNSGNGPVPVSPSFSVSATAVEDVMALSFTSNVGRIYRLQSTTNLPSGTWDDINYLIEGTGGDTLAFDPTGFTTQKAYRVIIP